MKKVDKSKVVRRSISIFITVLFLIYIFVNKHTIFGALENINFKFFVVVIFSQVLIQLFNSRILSATLVPLDINLSRAESFKLTATSSFVNFFTPVVGGASAKAIYLKSKHNLQYSSFITVLYANYIITFAVSFVFGLVGVLLIPGATQTHVGRFLMLVFAGGIISSVLVIFTGHKITKLIQRLTSQKNAFKSFSHKIDLIDDGWRKIRQNKKVVFAVVFWSACLMSSLVINYWASTHSLGIKTSLGSYMIYAALASISLLFNLTPGGIGVRETLYASTYKLSGINGQQVVAFSLVDRAAQLMVVGASWALFGSSMMKDVNFRQDGSNRS